MSSLMLCRETSNLCYKSQSVLISHLYSWFCSTVASALSRNVLKTHRWSLHEKYIWPVCHLWGIVKVDLFVTSANTKHLEFCSRGASDPRLMGEAIQIQWTTCFFYAFPPFILIQWVLLKIQPDRDHVTLIASRWPREVWFLLLWSLFRWIYIPVPHHNDLLQLGLLRGTLLSFYNMGTYPNHSELWFSQLCKDFCTAVIWTKFMQWATEKGIDTLCHNLSYVLVKSQRSWPLGLFDEGCHI